MSSLEAFRRYIDDPVAFFREILGLEVWHRQADLLRAVRDHDSVAVRAGQKVSKSTSIAGLGLWWTCTHGSRFVALSSRQTTPPARFIFSAPSDEQARENVYGEVLRLHESARIPLGGRIHEDIGDGIRWDDGRSIYGFSTFGSSLKLEKFLGTSGGSGLFLASDEAPGTKDNVLETIDGNRAGGGKFLLSGNPTRNHGFFYRAFHESASFWHRLRISSEESPNVTGIGPRIDGLATREYIEKRREQWGVNSWQYQVKILGEFAKQDENAFITLTLVEGAKLRWTAGPSPQDRAQRLRIGVDPARFGKDSSVLFPRRGRWAGQPLKLQKKNNVEVAGEVLRLGTSLAPGEPFDVVVDQTNNNGVADVLRAAISERPYGSPEIRVLEVYSQEGSSDPQWSNRRTQVWASLREWLKDAAIPDIGELHEELTAVAFGYDTRLRVQLEDKRSLVARLGRSPDLGDGLALSVWEGDAEIPWERAAVANLSSR